jgi:hypothetical protein
MQFTSAGCRWPRDDDGSASDLGPCYSPGAETYGTDKPWLGRDN